MSKVMKKIIKGLAWFVGSATSLFVAGFTGWIFYSRKYVKHNLDLDEAIDADRKEVETNRAGSLSYYSDLRGKGRPLVLLHSINAAPSAYEIKPVFNQFRGSRPVFALDLPGFGFSDRSERVYSPLLYQRAITAFLSDVVGEPADVVALSLSCEFAALAAAHDPQLFNSLVMISPTGFQPPKTDSLNEQTRSHNMGNAVYSALAVGLWSRSVYDLVSSRPSIQYFLNKSFEGLVPGRFVDYAYQTAHQPGAHHAPTYFLSGKLFTPAVRETVYKVLGLPVLVIHDRDSYTNFEMLPVLLHEKDNWQAVRVSPTKGLPHWEQPEKTFRAMSHFWDEV